MGEVCWYTSVLEERRESHAANDSPSGRPHGQVSTRRVDVRDSVSRGRRVKRTRPLGRWRGATARQRSRDHIWHRRSHNRCDDGWRRGTRTSHAGGTGRTRRGLPVRYRAAIGAPDRRLDCSDALRDWLTPTRLVVASHRMMMHRRRCETREGDGGDRGCAAGWSRRGSRHRCHGWLRRMIRTLLCTERHRRKRAGDHGRNQRSQRRQQSPQRHQSPHDQPAERENAGAVGVTPTPAVTESVRRLAPTRLHPAPICTGPSASATNGVAANSEP